MNTTLLQLENYKSDLNTILNLMDETSRNFYKEILEDIIDDLSGNEKPFTTYIKLPVNTLDDLLEDSFLKKRLDSIDTVWLFASTIGIEMYTYYENLSDPVEKVIFTYLMRQALDDIFLHGVKTIIKEMPKTSHVQMDIPGLIGQWNIKGQHQIVHLLENHYSGQLFPIFGKQLFFEKILYSYCGILYPCKKNSNVPMIGDILKGEIDGNKLLDYLNSSSACILE
ncbi:hypothetical protein P261_01387 [Lachnospiraceae bacterium TWA4]|nr:hypothetical protein P261_01387 [Lachnospiraceae bacterium TWA4]